MKNKILCLILSFCLILSCCNVAFAADGQDSEGAHHGFGYISFQAMIDDASNFSMYQLLSNTSDSISDTFNKVFDAVSSTVLAVKDFTSETVRSSYNAVRDAARNSVEFCSGLIYNSASNSFSLTESAYNFLYDLFLDSNNSLIPQSQQGTYYIRGEGSFKRLTSMLDEYTPDNAYNVYSAGHIPFTIYEGPYELYYYDGLWRSYTYSGNVQYNAFLFIVSPNYYQFTNLIPFGSESGQSWTTLSRRYSRSATGGPYTQAVSLANDGQVYHYSEKYHLYYTLLATTYSTGARYWAPTSNNASYPDITSYADLTDKILALYVSGSGEGSYSYDFDKNFFLLPRDSINYNNTFNTENVHNVDASTIINFNGDRISTEQNVENISTIINNYNYIYNDATPDGQTVVRPPKPSGSDISSNLDYIENFENQYNLHNVELSLPDNLNTSGMQFITNCFAILPADLQSIFYLLMTLSLIGGALGLAATFKSMHDKKERQTRLMELKEHQSKYYSLAQEYYSSRVHKKEDK